MLEPPSFRWIILCSICVCAKRASLSSFCEKGAKSCSFWLSPVAAPIHQANKVVQHLQKKNVISVLAESTGITFLASFELGRQSLAYSLAIWDGFFECLQVTRTFPIVNSFVTFVQVVSGETTWNSVFSPATQSQKGSQR